MSNHRNNRTDQKDMLKTEIRFPVLFQGIYTDLTIPGNIWMKDLRREKGFRRRDGEILRQAAADIERATEVRSPG